MKRILLIEDEMRLHKVFDELFRAENFELISAYDGESGLNLAQEVIPDLIILDLILPKKGGFEVLKEIKNNPILEKVPVMVLTNVESSYDVGQAFSLGACAYLTKANYSLEEIFQKIKEILKDK